MSSEGKEEGNAHLRAGELEKAIECYTRALTAAAHEEEEETSLDVPTRASLYANRALAHLRLCQHGACDSDCTLAIGLHPAYVKAWYRRGIAREALGKHADAFRDAREALRIDPSNKEAAALAARLKRALEGLGAHSDLSTPSLAVDVLREGAAATADERVRAAAKLSRIAEEKTRARELLHAGAVPVLAAIVPTADQLGTSAAKLQMPLLAFAVEALDRISVCEDTDVLHAIASASAEVAAGSREMQGRTALPDRLLALVRVAADAKKTLGGEGAGEHAQLKNTLMTATRSIALLANLGACRGAVGSTDAQAAIVRGLLPFARHEDDLVQRVALDALLRIVHADVEAGLTVLPDVLATLIHLVGDEDASTYRASMAILSKLFARSDKDKDEADNTQPLCNACEKVLSPVLRDASAEWEEHAAAVHGVTAVLAVNKSVGAWLLRQESIFWSLAEVIDIDDEDLQKSLAEVYAHAASDSQHFREQAGDEPIKHLKQMLKSPKPKIRARAAVALAKVALLHHNHRVGINPTGKLLSATLGLLEAKVPPSVHRWATEALMFLSVMPDVKDHLAEQQVRFGSLVALAESVKEDTSFHFALINAFRRLCVEREKPADQKRLEQEMDSDQIEQMRQLAAGGMGAAPSERKDDPQILTKLAATLVADDAVLVLSEIVPRLPADATSMRRSAAQVMLSMAQTVDCRGKIVQQGGFKALVSLLHDEDKETHVAAAWAVAKIGISINPMMYPRRLGSGPESMVKPLLKLVDEADNELQQFEACMTLCNLATLDDLKERIVTAGGWRTLQMTLASNNELVQRAALECMSNLVAHEQIIERFLDPESTDVKIFVGFCGGDDEKARVAASGAIAMLAGIAEVGAALIAAKAIEPLVDLALLSTSPELLHRAAVALERFFTENTELMVGKRNEEPPDHALAALGALMVLTKCSLEPAKKAALTALVHLQKSRPDVRLPPPEAVEEVVKRIQEEHEARMVEAEAAEAAEAAEETAASEANDVDAASTAVADDDDGTIV